MDDFFNILQKELNKADTDLDDKHLIKIANNLFDDEEDEDDNQTNSLDALFNQDKEKDTFNLNDLFKNDNVNESNNEKSEQNLNNLLSTNNDELETKKPDEPNAFDAGSLLKDLDNNNEDNTFDINLDNIFKNVQTDNTAVVKNNADYTPYTGSINSTQDLAEAITTVNNKIFKDQVNKTEVTDKLQNIILKKVIPEFAKPIYATFYSPQRLARYGYMPSENYIKGIIKEELLGRGNTNININNHANTEGANLFANACMDYAFKQIKGNKTHSEYDIETDNMEYSKRGRKSTKSVRSLTSDTQYNELVNQVLDAIQLRIKTFSRLNNNLDNACYKNIFKVIADNVKKIPEKRKPLISMTHCIQLSQFIPNGINGRQTYVIEPFTETSEDYKAKIESVRQQILVIKAESDRLGNLVTSLKTYITKQIRLNTKDLRTLLDALDEFAQCDSCCKDKVNGLNKKKQIMENSPNIKRYYEFLYNYNGDLNRIKEAKIRSNLLTKIAAKLEVDQGVRNVLGSTLGRQALNHLIYPLTHANNYALFNTNKKFETRITNKSLADFLNDELQKSDIRQTKFNSILKENIKSLLHNDLQALKCIPFDQIDLLKNPNSELYRTLLTQFASYGKVREGLKLHNDNFRRFLKKEAIVVLNEVLRIWIDQALDEVQDEYSTSI